MLNQVAVNRDTCSVPTSSTAINRANTIHIAGLTDICWSNIPLSSSSAMRMASSSWNTRAMINPIRMPNAIDKVMRAMAISIPIAAPVYAMARMFTAGPTNRNVIATPSPAPRFQMLAKRGSIVHEQTARIKPPIEAAG
jgi:hypothetical protein